jgi:hypothetical protein
MLHKIYERLDIIIPTISGSAFAFRNYILTGKLTVVFNFWQFALDTLLHLSQGIIVAIGTYIAVYFFKKIFHKTDKTKQHD